jgi:hypothetical protein
MGLNNNLTTDCSLSLVLFDSEVTVGLLNFSEVTVGLLNFSRVIVGLLNFSERHANLKSSVQ